MQRIFRWGMGRGGGGWRTNLHLSMKDKGVINLYGWTVGGYPKCYNQGKTKMFLSSVNRAL